MGTVGTGRSVGVPLCWLRPLYVRARDTSLTRSTGVCVSRVWASCLGRDSNRPVCRWCVCARAECVPRSGPAWRVVGLVSFQERVHL